jgi:hypothetical protein
VRITPRKDEVKAVVELLESDGYDSADALAKDLIKRVADLFSEREWWAYAFRFGPGSQVLSWGPLSSETEVKRFAERLSVEGEHLSVKLYSTAAALTRLEESAGAVLGKDATLCLNCGHPNGTHMHEKKIGICQLKGCGCRSNK